MKKLLLFLPLLFFFAPETKAQTNNGIIFVTTAPSGSCTARANVREKTPDGDLYTCASGTWRKTASGSTGATIPSTTNLLKGDGAGNGADAGFTPLVVANGTIAYCSDAGSTDSYACNLAPVPAGYVTGARYRFKANTSNTGAATINFNSLGAKTIVKVAGGITTALADNDIRVGQVVDLVYDGTNMQIQSTLGNAPVAGVTSVSGSCGITTTNPTTTPTVTGQELVNAQTGASYAIVTGDCGKTVTGTNAGAQAYSIAQAGSAGFASGWKADVQSAGAGTITITPATSTINGAATLLLTTGQSARIISDGTNYVALLGAGSAGGASPAGSYPQCQFNATSTTFGANAGCIGNFVDLAVPAVPVITNAGTAGVSTWGYKIISRNLVGGSAGASVAGTTTTGNATLTGVNYNIITPPACTSGVAFFDVYRTTAATSPTTTGMISPPGIGVACGGNLHDTGLPIIGGFTSLLTGTTDQGIGMGVPLVNTSGNVNFGTLAQASPWNDFAFLDVATGLGIYQNTNSAIWTSSSGYSPFVIDLVVDSNQTTNGIYTANIDTEIRNTGMNYLTGLAVSALDRVGATFQQYAEGITVANRLGLSTMTSWLYGMSVSQQVGSATDLISYYTYAPTVNTSVARSIAYFNENMCVVNATACFGWYGEGGTWHQETGGAAIIGLEIERASMQSADLQRFLDSDGTTVLSKVISSGGLVFPSYGTMTNCADSAGAAACGSAAAGRFVADAAATSVVVSTTAVTANSEIFIEYDSSLSAALSVTCNATIPSAYAVTARTAGTSFTLSTTANVANPGCFSYHVVN